MIENRYWRRHQKFSEWEDSVLRLALEAGYVSEQIGRMLGRSKSSIDTRCRHRRIPRRRYLHRMAVIFAGLMIFSGTAYAHDPSEPFADFFNSMMQPGTGISCCGSHHDCQQVDDYKAGEEPGSYQVKFNGNWLTVPASRVLQRTDNPTGRAVLCVHVGTPLCFIRATDS